MLKSFQIRNFRLFNRLEVKKLSNSFSDNPLNMEIVLSNIKNCERTYKERKHLYSL